MAGGTGNCYKKADGTKGEKERERDYEWAVKEFHQKGKKKPKCRSGEVAARMESKGQKIKEGKWERSL